VKDCSNIFHEEHRQLRPGALLPDLKIEFFAFANVNNTIRLREGRLLVRLSDLLEGAPQAVVRAIAHILLAKMYRKPIDRSHAARYRKYMASHEVVSKAHLVQQMRGRKRLHSPKGRVYDLDVVFEDSESTLFSWAAGPSAHELEPDEDSPNPRPLRSGAQCDRDQPHLRPVL
jgi:hypothetical protein